jgi:hypothetical protein
VAHVTVLSRRECVWYFGWVKIIYAQETSGLGTLTHTRKQMGGKDTSTTQNHTRTYTHIIIKGERAGGTMTPNRKGKVMIVKRGLVVP